MEKWDFSVTSDKITWDLSIEYSELYKVLYPHSMPWTEVFWRRFDEWVQAKYSVINRPSMAGVYAFANQEDCAEFILKCV
jgi:hypothetical protein